MIERAHYLSKLEEYLDTPLVKVIVGMRRSGKSVLLQQLGQRLISKGIPQENIIYFNFESLEWEHLTNYQELYQEIARRAHETKGRVYLLLDEVQEVASWERAINSFRVDLDCDIFITGSNERLLSGELASLLTGRYVEISIYPLSFAEHLEFQSIQYGAQDISPESSPGISPGASLAGSPNASLAGSPNGSPNNSADASTSLSIQKTLQESFEEYLWLGSLPGIHELPRDEQILRTYTKDVFNSILLKDVIRRNNLRDTELLERLLRFLLDNLGQIFSAKSITDFLKSQRRSLGVETIYNYLAALERAFLIYKVPRFDIQGKRQLETLEKYFVADHGVRHALLGFDSHEISGLLENVVYLELLRRGYTVSVGKQGNQEVDFVANRLEVRRYIQVCYLLANDDVINREFTPLRSIPDNHYKAVLSLDPIPASNIDGILRINIAHFLLDQSW